jgi:hypothetical protein
VLVCEPATPDCALAVLGERVDLTVIRSGTYGLMPGSVAAQDGLVSLSTNRVHRVLPDLTHVGLITSESGAAESSRANLDVVAAAMTSAALSD